MGERLGVGGVLAVAGALAGLTVLITGGERSPRCGGRGPDRGTGGELNTGARPAATGWTPTDDRSVPRVPRASGGV